jgi:NTP pyrophosphatase (non-canonical NTP hydrolase)
METEIQIICRKLQSFADERDWGKFHTPKNLAMATAKEAAELMEHFQWKTPEESASLDDRTRLAVGEEIADVFLYLIRLADLLGIDVVAEAHSKIEKNRAKYPVEKSRGNATKYTEF